MPGHHVMLDLETFGTRPGSAIRSIGAVVFGLSAGIGDGFYFNIDHQTCLDAGLTVDPQTVQWWSRQSQEAQSALLRDPKPLRDVVAAFNAWFARVGGKFVWSQGANFDGVLWEAAATAVGSRVPWKYHNARDTRTVYDLCGFDIRSVPRGGTYHNAFDDAKHQAALIQAALRGAASRSPKIAEVVR